MDLTYNYYKIRKDFGRQPMFSEVPVQLLDSIDPDKAMQKQYVLRNPVNKESQASLPMSEHLINTKRLVLQDQGANHAEGGWPKDVHFLDEEATSRYRRRVERDDDYVNAILNLNPQVEHYLNQNNAIDMYHMYFEGMEETQPMESFGVKINNAYRDVNERPIACINWTHEDDSKIVVAYCDKKYPINKPVNKIFTCSVWDMENSTVPAFDFEPPTPCWQIACSPGAPNIIVGGLQDGRVCIFDIRDGKDPICISEVYLAHRDPVNALIYMPTRTNNEFFSGSTDGMCMWYDTRNIKMPTETLMMTIRVPPGESLSMAHTEGVSVLQYDRAFPTRFFCGTDTGFVVNVNRKGKTLNEILSATIATHWGPVRAVHRSPCTSKVFITCGDWTTHIWSEEILSSPIITGTQQPYPVFDVTWAPNRVTSYMTVSGDGKFRYWDLLRKVREPQIVLPLTKCALLKIKPHDEGRLIAMGDAKGAIHLITLSESLVVSGDRDKSLMLQKYERETRRERILENRVKEIRLKLKADDEAVVAPAEVIDEEALDKAAEDEYRRVILEELRSMGEVRPIPVGRVSFTGKPAKLRSR